MLKCEVAAILLTEDGAYDRAFLLAESVSSDVVRDCEEDERMELDADGCVGGFVREERIRGCCLARHGCGCCRWLAGGGEESPRYFVLVIWCLGV